MNNKIKSLRAMAQSALTEYSDESSSGGEPDYPQWAQDLLDVLNALDEIGAGGVSGKIVDDSLRKDAERYRWLRDGGNDDIGVVMGFDSIDSGSTTVVGTYEEGLDGEQLDESVDLAMIVERKG